MFANAPASRVALGYARCSVRVSLAGMRGGFAGSRNESCNLLYYKFGWGARVPAHMTIADLRLSIRHQGAYSTMMRSQFGHDADFYCPHCGALFVVSYTKLPIADSGSEYCECCKRRMIQWNSALQPRYRLVQRTDPAQR